MNKQDAINWCKSNLIKWPNVFMFQDELKSLKTPEGWHWHLTNTRISLTRSGEYIFKQDVLAPDNKGINIVDMVSIIRKNDICISLETSKLLKMIAERSTVETRQLKLLNAKLETAEISYSELKLSNLLAKKNCKSLNNKLEDAKLILTELCDENTYRLGEKSQYMAYRINKFVGE